jgi:hypothetical protein
MDAQPGSFDVTGFVADLLKAGTQYTMDAQPGVIVITGAAASALLNLDDFPEGGGDGERIHTRGIVDFNWGPR